MHDVIDIDDDDDSEDLLIIGENVGKSNKGKAIEAIHNGYGDHQVVVCIRCYLLSLAAD